MRKLGLILCVISLLLACERKNKSISPAVSDKVEIEFSKDGELFFMNENGVVFKQIDIEIADTENKRARGLMDRSSMEEDFGMLFIFDDDQVRQHTFYMKNTRIPLDIMYFDRDTVLINIARNAQPGADSEVVVGGTVAAAKKDSKFVVEINGGLADEWGVVEGETKFRWKLNEN